MHDQEMPIPPAPWRTPWNKGKLTGAKPPLRQKHVWAIRTKLQVEGRPRDLAMFNLAIDSKLRGCDVVGGVEDVLLMVTLSIMRPYTRGRPASLSGSKSRSRPERRSTVTSKPPIRNQASTSLAAVAGRIDLP